MSFSITPVSGTGSYTIPETMNALLGIIIITPATATTKHRFRITQADDTILYEKTTLATGRLALMTPLPLVGDLTFTILGATVDEQIDVKIIYQ